MAAWQKCCLETRFKQKIFHQVADLQGPESFKHTHTNMRTLQYFLRIAVRVCSQRRSESCQLEQPETGTRLRSGLSSILASQRSDPGWSQTGYLPAGGDIKGATGMKTKGLLKLSSESCFKKNRIREVLYLLSINQPSVMSQVVTNLFHTSNNP